MQQTRNHPLSYEVEAAKAGVTTTIPRGLRPIRVQRIVGSAGKAEMIGLDFLPLGAGPAQSKYRAILRLMESGAELPPISVYQLRQAYYVIDGHTRVAAAKALGITFIDAEVTEALPRRAGEENLAYYARRTFESETGLESVRLTAAWRYERLRDHIEGYRLYLEHSWGRTVTLTDAARIWYRTQYMPTLIEIRRRRLRSSTGGRTAGDVYTDLLKVWAEEAQGAMSLREMLDYYDTAQVRGFLTRATRTVTSAVDAALPKAVPPITAPTREKLADLDVEAELTGAEGIGTKLTG